MSDELMPPPNAADDRWKLVRDVAVFQLKLFLDNVRDLLLVPVSLVAALIDLVFGGRGEGALFYKVLRWGSHSEEVIDVYSAIKHHEPGNFKVNPGYTVDGVIARLENVLKREVEKGGTAASVKAAMDKAIDQLHSETVAKRDEAREMVSRTAESCERNLCSSPGGTLGVRDTGTKAARQTPVAHPPMSDFGVAGRATATEEETTQAIQPVSNAARPGGR